MFSKKNFMLIKKITLYMLTIVAVFVFGFFPNIYGNKYQRNGTPKEVFKPAYLRNEFVIDESKTHMSFYVNDTLFDVIYKENGLFRKSEKEPELSYGEFLFWREITKREEVIFPVEASSNMIVEAVFEIDYEKLTNEITVNHISSNVQIKVYEYINLFGINVVPTLLGATGSGVIFHEQNDYYFVLTNYHVAVETYGKNTKNSLRVVDHLGNEYVGFYKKEYANKELDLSVVTFKKDKNVELRVQKFAEKNPEKWSKILAITSPGGQKNSISYGTFYDYRETILNGNDFKINSMISDYPAEGGSSGGGVYNMGMKIIGIHTFGDGKPMQAEQDYSGFIPVADILIFLEEKLWNI